MVGRSHADHRLPGEVLSRPRVVPFILRCIFGSFSHEYYRKKPKNLFYASDRSFLCRVRDELLVSWNGCLSLPYPQYLRLASHFRCQGFHPVLWKAKIYRRPMLVIRRFCLTDCLRVKCRGKPSSKEPSRDTEDGCLRLTSSPGWSRRSLSG